MRNSHPFVSVIIPVFNDHRGLILCLDGIAEQSYPSEKIEAIVVDNGSTPAITLPCSYKFQTKLEVCQNPGAYAARNFGARVAQGEVLAFTDADCIPDKDWITEGVKALKKTKGESIVGGEVQFIPPIQRTGTALYQYKVGFQQKENIELKGFTATANLFCLRTQFDQTGPFSEVLLSGGDRLWSWKARERGYTVTYHHDAIVKTYVRTSLRNAITQARRVTGGRMVLQHMGSQFIKMEGIQRHRSILESIKWICTLEGTNKWERIRILYAASAIRLFQSYERLLLELGKPPERR